MKDNIYDTLEISPEDIIAKFIGEYEVNQLMRSPLRDDNNPSFKFFYTTKIQPSRLFWKDHSTGEGGDAINLVAKLHNCTNTQAIQIVSDTFKSNKTIYYKEQFMCKYRKKRQTNNKYCVKYDRNWFSWELDFWKEIDQTKEDLAFWNVFAAAGISGGYSNKLMLPSVKGDPTYVYIFSEIDNSWKTYKPYRAVDDGKWRSQNIDGHIQGWKQLPETGRVVGITSSLKDSMCWRKLGIPTVSTHNENILLQEPLVRELQQRFDFVFCNMDNDKTGMDSNRAYQTQYGLPIFHIPHGVPNPNKKKDCSDPDDVYRGYGQSALVDMFASFKNIHKLIL